MTIIEFKALVRQVVKVAPGGPNDRTRGRNLIDLLNMLADKAFGAWGASLVSFTITNNNYPDRKLVAKTRNDEELAIDVAQLQTLETVAFADFQPAPGGGIEPYTFKKGVVYRDTVIRKAFECQQEHTVTSRLYPTEGPFFLEVPYLTKEAGEDLQAQLSAVQNMIANMPGKMPRYYSVSTNGSVFSGEALNAVAGSVGNGSGRVYVMGYGTLSGDATLRYNNLLIGNGYTVELNGFSLTQGRGSNINDLHLRNGKLGLYGQGPSNFNGGSLTETAIANPGGQSTNLIGTIITCSAGFRLVQDGVVVNWYGSATNPNPTIPAGADVSGGTINIIPYVAPAATGAGLSLETAATLAAISSDITRRLIEVTDTGALYFHAGTKLKRLTTTDVALPSGGGGQVGGGGTAGEMLTDTGFNQPLGPGGWQTQGDWSITDGKATNTGGEDRIYQLVQLEAGKTYRIQIEVESVAGGGIAFNFNHPETMAGIPDGYKKLTGGTNDFTVPVAVTEARWFAIGGNYGAGVVLSASLTVV